LSKDSDPTRGGAALPPSSPYDPERATSSQEQERISAFLKELARSPAGDPRDAFAGFRVGERVGRFELLREMGRGGFGVVYEALDHELGRAVAFKAVRPGRAGAAEKGEQWLHSEAKAAARLSHPNIITLHDFGTCPAGPYLVMELLRGETLEKRLNHGPLAPREAIRIAVEVARALCHAHAAGVLHRDVKPSNVFLTHDGAVKVLDFGLARVLGTAGPGGGGTPAFMAPEQWLGGEEDARTDVFSASAVLFQALTGELPFAVTRERSAVLDPGPPPEPRRPGVPRQLAALIRGALSREPADRPRNAQVWLEGLLSAQRTMARREERRRGLRLRAALALAGLAAAAVALTRCPGAPNPSPALPRVAVVVPDIVDHTPERDLGTLSGMLVTALEQSKRLDIVTRWRALDLLRKEGHGDVDVIDERRAREVARLIGARILMLSSVRRFDETYALDLQAIDLRDDRYLFTRRMTGKGRASIPGTIDALAESARADLKEGAAELRERGVKVESALTADLEAYEHYHRGVACNHRPGAEPKRCAEDFRRAIAKDPEFTLAHYRLALATQYRPELADERKAAIGRAKAGIRKLPAKERALVEAYAEHVDGRDDAALALYREAIEEYPSDKEALYLAGDILHHRADLPGAVGYFERALDLDPGLALDQSLEWPLDHLPGDLGRLARRDRLQQLVVQWSKAPPSAAVDRALSQSYLWLGRRPEAVSAGERAVKSGGGAPAVRDLAAARFFSGDHRGAEAALRSSDGSGPWLAWLAAAQGRRREALQAVPDDDPSLHFYRAALLLGDEPGALWAECRQYRAPSRPYLAIPLAYRGDLEHAAELAKGLEKGSPGEVVYRATLAWRRGAHAAAREALLALEKRDLLPPSTFAPSFLLGEMAAGSGDDAGAIEALERYRSLPYFGIWQGWAWPRSLYLLARSHERLGHRRLALQRAEDLLELLRGADPGTAIAAEARALHDRLRGAENRPARPVSPP